MFLEMFLMKIASSAMDAVLSDDPTPEVIPEVIPEVKEESSSTGLIIGGGVALGALALLLLSKNKDERK